MDLIRYVLDVLAGRALTLSFDKGGDSPPAAPAPIDPSVQIAAQAKALPSVKSPYGTQIYSGDPNVAGSFTRTDTLSPEQQQLYEGRTGVANALLNRSSTAMSSLPAVYKFDPSNPASSSYLEGQQKVLDKMFSRDEERLDQKLANQGIPMGSDAYGKEFDDFRSSKGDAYEKAASGAFGQDLALRQQNLNEIAQALGGSQLTPVTGGGSPLDPASAYAASEAAKSRAYSGQLAGYNAGVSGQNSMNTGLFGLGAAALPLMASDRRVKRDIQRVGELLPGVGWYSYHYAWDVAGAPLRHGVMADELELVMPDAVLYDGNGYAMVDYGRLFSGRTLQ